jgi:hypothetical protein
VRCTLAAVIIAVIEPIINKIGLGWTFIILGALMLLTVPLIYLEMALGPKYRRARFRKAWVVPGSEVLEAVTSDE